MMKEKVLMKGNEALAEAAILAGCRFYAGYPITPQSEIPEYLAKRMPQVEGLFLQAESEIASINMVYGAAGAGGRAMTSSSSPGISLMQETISSLAAAELPCLIVNMARGGPGLGSIQGAQSDYIQSTRGGGHGDYRLFVLAPNSAQEMIDLTFLAFERADFYRIPALILGDGTLGQMMEPVEFPDPITSQPARDWAATGFSGREERNIINTLYLGKGECEDHNVKLQAKYRLMEANEVRWEEIGTEDAEWVIVAYGISSRIALSAMQMGREKGLKIGIFRPITLWPFPVEPLKALIPKVKGFISVEQSAGQLIEDIRLTVEGAKPVGFYGRPGGSMLRADEVLTYVEKFIEEQGGRS